MRAGFQIGRPFLPYQFMVVVPLFDKEQWIGGDYSYASVITKDGKLRTASMLSFNVIEHLFHLIKRSTDIQNSTYFIYGHSEGGQFVHRLVLFLPEARYARAVAANPGWYTIPTFEMTYRRSERCCSVLIVDAWKDARGFYESLGWTPPDSELTRIGRFV